MARHPSYLGGLCAGLFLASAAPAQVTGIFSTERTFTATAGPHAGAEVSHGDLLNTRADIVRTNFNLIEQFCKKPIARDVGLDALHIMPDGQILFSVEDSFFAECQGRDISHGDILTPEGIVFRTNAQLMVNFHPKPPTPDMGLDAFHVLPGGEVLFSIEDDIFDEQLGVLLTNGDILSESGRVVRTNRQLIANFHPQPPIGNHGVDVIVARPFGEFWWSPETGWFDELLGVNISEGDLLSDAGYVVATEAQLLAAFLGAEPPPGIGLDAFALPASFAACGTLQAGPACTVFVPDGSFESYFVENIEGHSLGDHVFISGELNPESNLCVTIPGPGIENNVIGPCFEACGFLAPGPQGCAIFRIGQPDGPFYYIQNLGEFNFGDQVYVRGILNVDSPLCLPPGGPAIEHNLIFQCFSACGQIIDGPQGCPQLLPDGSKDAIFLENVADFQVGDHVFVQGPIVPFSDICGPFTAAAIEDNSIGQCFEGCGFLVRGAECTLFEPHAGGLYRLSNYGDFQVGDEVFVRGQLFEVCFSTCQQGGCIEHNDISPCCPCDWNAHDGVNSQDFFDFLTDFFNGDADFNNDTFTNSQDFFDFLICFFNGCR